MAQYNVPNVLQLYVQAGLNNGPNDGDILTLRLTSGDWGIGDRYARVQLRIIDAQGQALPNPRWIARAGPVDLINDIVLQAPENIMLAAFPNLQVLNGVYRHGPLHDGNIQPGDPLSDGFLPVTDGELQAVPPAQLMEECILLREIVHRQQVQQLRAGLLQPPQLPAPVPAATLPINHIRGVVGATPSDAKDVALWIGRNVHGIEGIFPIPDAQVRMRVVNALTSMHPGLAVTLVEAGSWDRIVASLFQKAHGMQAQHQLPKVLEEIAKKEGVIMAFNVGMMFTANNFQLTWGIVRGHLPGQALVTHTQQRLDALPDDPTRGRQLPGILTELYQLLGLDPLGRQTRTVPQKNSPNSTNRNQNNSTSRGRGNPSTSQRGNFQRGRGRGRGGTGRQQFQNQQNINFSNNTHPPRAGGGYNFRTDVYQPNWYGGRGGGRHPYRGQSADQAAQPQNRSESTDGSNRGNSQPRGRGSGRGRVINSVQTGASNSGNTAGAAESQNASQNKDTTGK